jgi:hypothetical protein
MNISQNTDAIRLRWLAEHGTASIEECRDRLRDAGYNLLDSIRIAIDDAIRNENSPAK